MTKHRSAHCNRNNWHYHHQAGRNNIIHTFTLQPFQLSIPTGSNGT